jgi:hypothetical protein
VDIRTKRTFPSMSWKGVRGVQDKMCVFDTVWTIQSGEDVAFRTFKIAKIDKNTTAVGV